MSEPTLSSRTVYEGKLFTVKVDRVRLPNGREHVRELILHPQAVVLVPIDGAGNILLVRQYRKGADETLLELPAGKIEPGEDPDDCANRELAEETGYAAGQLDRLGAFYAAPSYCSEILHCYLARDLRPTTGTPEDDESIELVPTPLDEVLRLLGTGALRDAKTLAGLALALPRLGRVKSEE